MKKKNARKIVLGLTIAYISLKLRKKKQKRGFWVRIIFLNRKLMRFFETTYQEMKSGNPEMFFKTFRMDSPTMQELFLMIEHRLRKTSIRKAIVPECRLVLIIM